MYARALHVHPLLTYLMEIDKPDYLFTLDHLSEENKVSRLTMFAICQKLFASACNSCTWIGFIHSSSNTCWFGHSGLEGECRRIFMTNQPCIPRGLHLGHAVIFDVHYTAGPTTVRVSCPSAIHILQDGKAANDQI